MKTINLRWMYPHYRHDEFVDVTDEVWAAMYQAKREMENYERRKVYHRAYYSLDAYSWLENYALEHSRSPEDILLEREEMTTRLHLIAALPLALLRRATAVFSLPPERNPPGIWPLPWINPNPCCGVLFMGYALWLSSLPA